MPTDADVTEWKCEKPTEDKPQDTGKKTPDEEPADPGPIIQYIQEEPELSVEVFVMIGLLVLITVLFIFIVVCCIARRKHIFKVQDSKDNIKAEDKEGAGDIEDTRVFEALNSAQRFNDQSSPAQAP